MRIILFIKCFLDEIRKYKDKAMISLATWYYQVWKSA